MEKITSLNCTEYANKQEIVGDVEGKSQCWSTVFNFCVQNGMPEIIEKHNGIERVILFLESYITKSQTH